MEAYVEARGSVHLELLLCGVRYARRVTLVGLWVDFVCVLALKIVCGRGIFRGGFEL